MGPASGFNEPVKPSIISARAQSMLDLVARSARPKHAFPLVLLSLGVAALGVLSAWRYGRDRAGQDFYQQPWAVSELRPSITGHNIWDQPVRRQMAATLLAVVGGGPKHTVPAGLERQARAALLAHPPKRNELAVAGTPFFFAALSPFHSGLYERDGLRYLAALIACSGVAILVLSANAGLGAIGALLLCGLLFTWFEPWKAELRVWNVNSILLATLAAATWCLARGKTSALGALLAMGAAFKPTLAPAIVALTVFWLVHRQFSQLRRLVLGATFGALVAILIGCWWLKRADAWLLFLRSLGQITGESYAMRFGNFSLNRWLVEQEGGTYGAVLLAATLIPICIGIGVSAWRHRTSDAAHYSFSFPTLLVGQAESAIHLGVLTMLIVAPLAWLHYFIILIGPAISALRQRHHWEHQAWAHCRQILGALSLLLLCEWPTIIPTPFQSGSTKPFLLTVSTVTLFSIHCVNLAGGIGRWRPRAGYGPTPPPATGPADG